MKEFKSTSVEVRLPSRMGFEKVAMSTASAVAEACINAIEHGNRMNEKLSVGVILSAQADKLEVKVIAVDEQNRVKLSRKAVLAEASERGDGNRSE